MVRIKGNAQRFSLVNCTTVLRDVATLNLLVSITSRLVKNNISMYKMCCNRGFASCIMFSKIGCAIKKGKGIVLYSAVSSPYRTAQSVL